MIGVPTLLRAPLSAAEGAVGRDVGVLAVPNRYLLIPTLSGRRQALSVDAHLPIQGRAYEPDFLS